MAFAFLGVAVIGVQLVHTIAVPRYIIMAASLCTATYSSIIVYGLLVNLREIDLRTRVLNWLIVGAQVALMPVFGVLESIAIP